MGIIAQPCSSKFYHCEYYHIAHSIFENKNMQLSELLKDRYSDNYIHVMKWEKYYYFFQLCNCLKEF